MDDLVKQGKGLMKELQLNSQWAFGSMLEILGYIAKGEEKKVMVT